ncbi:hypothetical protein Tco_0462488 [Tanacetum coccineum]
MDALDRSDRYFALDAVDQHLYLDILHSRASLNLLANNLPLEVFVPIVSVGGRSLTFLITRDFDAICVTLKLEYEYVVLIREMNLLNKFPSLKHGLSKADTSRDAHEAFRCSTTVPKFGFPFEIG